MPEPRPLPPPAECANCGATIPRRATACPDCGADERTGWRETPDSIYDGLDLPEDAFEEDASRAGVKRARPSHRVNGISWYWWGVGLALLGALVAWALGVR